MRIVKSIAELRALVKAWKQQGATVGLVPTMGYLHDGHASLVRAAKAECDHVVVSVFVNPTQFGPNEDLQSYPRDLQRDAALLDSLEVDVLFHPEPEEMYQPGACTWVQVEGLSKGLCGKTRPIHFRGVCTVVCKLLCIALPDAAFFGQKDAQQLAIVRRMVRDLNLDVRIVGCPIVREADGLAKSSRNTYLSAEQRQAALVLSKAIFAGQRAAENGQVDTAAIVALMQDIVQSEAMARIDYIEAVDAETIEPVAKIEHRPVLFAMAVYIGSTRLIDNFIFPGAVHAH